MATLGVQEAMGAKVDREAIATLVLPQLWAMSMGPCPCKSLLQSHALTQIPAVLNADQFGRFMACVYEQSPETFTDPVNPQRD